MSAKGTHSRLPNNDEEEDVQTEISEDLESNSTVSQFEIEKIRVGERHLGTSLAFYFKNGEPLMTIGPHCNVAIDISLNVNYVNRAVLCLYVDLFGWSWSISNQLCLSKVWILGESADLLTGLLGSIHLFGHSSQKPRNNLEKVRKYSRSYPTEQG